MVLFKDLYKKLAIYSNIENPRFSFGMSAMLLQGVVFAYLHPLVGNTPIFGAGSSFYWSASWCSPKPENKKRIPCRDS